MSEVLPFNEENMSHYGNEGDEGHLSFTCRLQDTNNFFSGPQNKRPPKLGQIGRSKRDEDSSPMHKHLGAAPVGDALTHSNICSIRSTNVVIEDENGDDKALKNGTEKTSTEA